MACAHPGGGAPTYRGHIARRSRLAPCCVGKFRQSRSSTKSRHGVEVGLGCEAAFTSQLALESKWIWIWTRSLTSLTFVVLPGEGFRPWPSISLKAVATTRSGLKERGGFRGVSVVAPVSCRRLEVRACNNASRSRVRVTSRYRADRRRRDFSSRWRSGTCRAAQRRMCLSLCPPTAMVRWKRL